jgi:hypothetical protein
MDPPRDLGPSESYCQRATVTTGGAGVPLGSFGPAPRPPAYFFVTGTLVADSLGIGSIPPDTVTSTSRSGSIPGISARFTKVLPSWYSSTRIKSSGTASRNSDPGRNGISLIQSPNA